MAWQWGRRRVCKQICNNLCKCVCILTIISPIAEVQGVGRGKYLQIMAIYNLTKSADQFVLDINKENGTGNISTIEILIPLWNST